MAVVNSREHVEGVAVARVALNSLLQVLLGGGEVALLIAALAEEKKRLAPGVLRELHVPVQVADNRGIVLAVVSQAAKLKMRQGIFLVELDGPLLVPGSLVRLSLGAGHNGPSQ